MTSGRAVCDALVETFALYFMGHSFHWNVEGPLFSQLHELFGKIYEDAVDAVDDLAEHIRALGEYAPTEMRAVDAGGVTSAMEMVERLRGQNEIVLAALTAAMTEAEADRRPGLVNFLQDRIDKHAKWGWMLAATVKERSGAARIQARYKEMKNGPMEK